MVKVTSMMAYLPMTSLISVWIIGLL